MIEPGGALNLSRQCARLGVSRSSQYYRPKGESAENLALMRRMDELHMEYPCYGRRQMMRHLRREGVTAGRHRIRRLMRSMGMEAAYRRLRTTVPSPEHPVYPYLLRGLTISRPDHVWCADITYIPVTRGFFYLVAAMDWAIRHVLAWRLSNTMDATYCIEALEHALDGWTPEVLNNDHGTQFTSAGFRERVLTASMRFSMDGRGRFHDNILVERLWRSLKYEAVYLHELRDGLEAERVIGSWIEFYNRGAPPLSFGRTTAGGCLSRPQGSGVSKPSVAASRRMLRGRPVVGRMSDLSIPRRSRPSPESAGWQAGPRPPTCQHQDSRGLGKPSKIHLNFALGLSNKVGPPQLTCSIGCILPQLVRKAQHRLGTLRCHREGASTPSEYEGAVYAANRPFWHALRGHPNAPLHMRENDE